MTINVDWKINISIYRFQHLSIFTKIHRDISIQIQQSMSIFSRSIIFTQSLKNTSKNDNLRRLIYISVFPFTCIFIWENIKRYTKINLTTIKLISGDIAIGKKRFTSYNINQHAYINGAVVEFRYFQLRYDAHIHHLLAISVYF